ncbi:MAG: 1,4-alpha-glucan branching protein GlgB [Bacteroidia bacterium]
MQNRIKVYSLFTELDIHLFKEGKHFRLYEKMGSHPIEVEGVKGVYFAVWAPNAKSVGVIGDFNYWKKAGDYELFPRWDGSGIWEGFLPEIEAGETYKYGIETREGHVLEKADLYAYAWEKAPSTGTKIQTIEYKWKDQKWMKSRAKKNALDAPISVYEVHLGSWLQGGNGPEDFITYREMIDKMVPYVKEMGYTHVELLPVMEHPFYGSWGYQVLGYFAPTSRYGTPQDFMALVEAFHNAGIGVFLDWVPSHFPGDAHGIKDYDGTALYEHADPRQGYHPDWSSYIFNYGRNEVRSFLISNAIFWLDKYHVDGLRVDAVASMLYLDYSRKEGEWVPNQHGGRENLEAMEFLKNMNEAVYKEFPDVQTIAEESTSFPMISRPTFLGGLGFGMKWMMGWMNDTLEYFKEDPINRKYHHNKVSFSLTYAFTENFMLPLSHDEVVHGKGSILDRMPGDNWQKMANARLLYAYMFTHPGTKLNFMGNEIGQWQEWKHTYSLDWHLLENKENKGLQTFVKDLNKLYKKEKPLFEIAYHVDGFEWVDYSDHANSVLAYLRKDKSGNQLLVICNFTPVAHDNYRVGVPFEKDCKEILSSDAKKYGGSGISNKGKIAIEAVESHGKAQSINVKLPPLGVAVFKG